MTDMNRREFVNLTIGAAAATALCNYCGGEEHADAIAVDGATTGPATGSAASPIDAGPISSFAANSISDKFVKKGAGGRPRRGPGGSEGRGGEGRGGESRGGEGRGGEGRGAGGATSEVPSFFVIHNGEKLYASSAICTHKSCVLHVKGTTTMFCDCHNSSFSIEGTPTEGPAKSSLVRYKVSKSAAGHLMVDTSTTFREAKWDDADSFIAGK